MSSTAELARAEGTPRVGAVRVAADGARGGGDARALWPTHKLRPLPPPDGPPPHGPPRRAALVLTGALNPVHVGHVASLVGARAALEARGWEVVAGWVSPSHASYVRPKMERSGGLFLPTPTRVRCVELAVADTDWIACGRWESMGPHASWPDFPVVVASLQDHLRTIGRADVAVFFVCGHDHYLKCGLRVGMRRRGASAAVPAPGLAVLPRGGSRPVKDKAAGERGPVVGVEAKHAPPKVSSTNIRRLLRRHKGGGGATAAAEQGLLHPAVGRYLDHGEAVVADDGADSGERKRGKSKGTRAGTTSDDCTT